MDSKNLVCLICCKEFSGGCGGGDMGRKEENVQSLKQFCEVILEVNKNELKGGQGLVCFHANYKGDNLKGVSFGDDVKEEDVDHDLNDKLSKFLNNPDDNLSICGNCLDLMETVTEARLSARCVEESVEKLQMLLLRELRRLQGRLELFWRKFEKMEETLVNGDLELMGNNLNESYSRRKEGGKISEQQKLERSKEIVGFRVKISAVFREFHQFHSKLINKIACPPDVLQPTKPVTLRRTKTETTPSKKIVTPQVKVKTQGKPKDKPVDKQSQNLNNKRLSFPPPLPLLPRFDEIAHEEEDDEDWDWEMKDEPMHLNSLDDKHPLHHSKKKDKEGSSHSEQKDDPQNSEEEDSGGEYIRETSKSSKQIKPKPADKRLRPRRRAKCKKQDKRKLEDSEEEDEEEHNSSEDNDEEYNPKQVNRPLTYQTKIINLLREYEPHLVTMSPFQRNLVESIIKCKCLNEYYQKRKGAEKMNVFKRHMTYLSYNVETQLINLKDIPIKVVCQAEGEDQGNGLLCTKCDFNVPESPKMERLMYDHVLAKHLNAYQCPHCKDKTLESYNRYSNHVYRCSEANKVECDVCGKILCDVRSLERHKWSHMSEQERTEALKSGLVRKAPLIKSINGMEKRFQCVTCGKGFAMKQSLVNHEETHLDRESREQIVCPKCGKSFLESGYRYHLKFDAVCGEGDPKRKTETCVKCGKVLKNKATLRIHVREMHVKAEMRGDSRPFVCATCGKTFAKSVHLKTHEKTHTDARPWTCDKCGSRYKVKSHLTRHEATCSK